MQQRFPAIPGPHSADAAGRTNAQSSARLTSPAHSGLRSTLIRPRYVQGKLQQKAILSG
jgi:hypothetical protein